MVRILFALLPLYLVLVPSLGWTGATSPSLKSASKTEIAQLAFTHANSDSDSADTNQFPDNLPFDSEDDDSDDDLEDEIVLSIYKAARPARLAASLSHSQSPPHLYRDVLVPPPQA